MLAFLLDFAFLFDATFTHKDQVTLWSSWMALGCNESLINSRFDLGGPQLCLQIYHQFKCSCHKLPFTGPLESKHQVLNDWAFLAIEPANFELQEDWAATVLFSVSWSILCRPLFTALFTFKPQLLGGVIASFVQATFVSLFFIFNLLPVKPSSYHQD